MLNENSRPGEETAGQFDPNDTLPSRQSADKQALYRNIPVELRERKQWVVWRFEKREGSEKPTKVPYSPATGLKASVTDPSTWGTYDKAVQASQDYSGIGFVLYAGDPYCFIDLDDAEGDAVTKQVQRRTYDTFPSYAERSPSGQGLHIIAKGHVPAGRRRGKIELYGFDRYMTMTGDVVRNVGILDAGPHLQTLYDELGGQRREFSASPFFQEATESDEAIRARAFSAANGDKFRRLYSGDASDLAGDKSGSAVDMALVDILPFYTPDPAQIERIWLANPQGSREKTQSRRDYRQRTISEAFNRHLAPVAHNLQFGKPVPPPAQEPTVIDAGMWEGQSPPYRTQVWVGWVAAGQVTYVTGAGAVGKSLFLQNLTTSTALGRPFLGQQTVRGVALYVTCEDDPGELHRRQVAICAALGEPVGALRRQLGIAALIGAIGNELATFDRTGAMTQAPAFAWLERTIKAMGATLVIVDNVAHFFAGDENNRHQVAAFVGLLNALANETGAAIVLVGHPNKAGAGYSGSTAWENQVRTRLFIGIPQNAEGHIPDLDARILTRAKANYGRAGDAIKFRWHNHAFVAESDLAPDVGAAIAANIQANAENAAFLACLAKAADEKRAVSPSPSAANFAPKVFAAMPTGKGIRKAGFEAAMQRLLHTAGTLATSEASKLGYLLSALAGILTASDLETRLLGLEGDKAKR